MMRGLFQVGLAAGLLLGGAAEAQEMDHSAHQAPASEQLPVESPDSSTPAVPMPEAVAPEGMDHGAHQMPMPDAPPGEASWSYEGRDNPQPRADDRWEMVPGEGSGAFISAPGLGAGERCAAILSNPGVMVDRATRGACAAPGGSEPGDGAANERSLQQPSPAELAAAPLPSAASPGSVPEGRIHLVRMVYDEATGELAFTPERLEIEPGDTVIWINDDAVNEHNVVAYPDRIPAEAEFFEGPLLTEKGQGWSTTFTVPGSYYYHCHPHEAVMRGLVVVGRESRPDEFRQIGADEMTHDHGVASRDDAHDIGQDGDSRED